MLAAIGAEPLKIRGTAFANWWRIGETVCFKGNQPIPENDRIRVKVNDVTGATLYTGEAGSSTKKGGAGSRRRRDTTRRSFPAAAAWTALSQKVTGSGFTNKIGRPKNIPLPGIRKSR